MGLHIKFGGESGMGGRQGCRLSGRMSSGMDLVAGMQYDLGCSVVQYILAMLGVQQVLCASNDSVAEFNVH